MVSFNNSWNHSFWEQWWNANSHLIKFYHIVLKNCSIANSDGLFYIIILEGLLLCRFVHLWYTKVILLPSSSYFSQVTSILFAPSLTHIPHPLLCYSISLISAPSSLLPHPISFIPPLTSHLSLPTSLIPPLTSHLSHPTSHIPPLTFHLPHPVPLTSHLSLSTSLIPLPHSTSLIPPPSSHFSHPTSLVSPLTSHLSHPTPSSHLPHRTTSPHSLIPHPTSHFQPPSSHSLILLPHPTNHIPLPLSHLSHLTPSSHYLIPLPHPLLIPLSSLYLSHPTSLISSFIPTSLIPLFHVPSPSSHISFPTSLIPHPTSLIPPLSSHSFISHFPHPSPSYPLSLIITHLISHLPHHYTTLSHHVYIAQPPYWGWSYKLMTSQRTWYYVVQTIKHELTSL